MQISSPQRVEGEVWLEQFNLHLTSWLAQQRQQPSEFEQAIDALRNMLEREPATAGFVANLLSTLVKRHAGMLPSSVVEVAARRGIEAVRLVTDVSALRHLTYSSLLNHLALAYCAQGKFRNALDEALASQAQLEDPLCKVEVLTSLMRAEARLIEGRCREGLLEYDRAVESYDEAEATAAGITEDDRTLSDMLAARIRFEYPLYGQLPPEAINSELTLLWRQLCSLRIESATGAGRCAVICKPDKVDARLQKMVEISRRNGIGDTTPLEMASVICAASHEVASAGVQQIVEMVGKLRLEVAEFSGVLQAALSVTAETETDRRRAQESAKKGLAQTADPLIQAAILGLLLCSHEDSTARESIVDNFILLLEQLGRAKDPRLAVPANRMVFDEPVLLALHALCARGNGRLPWTPFQRTMQAKLIDFDFSGLSPVDQWFRVEAAEKNYYLEDLARDRLARVHAALREWDDALVLIVRTVRERSLFIALTGAAEPVAVFDGDDYFCTARALANFVDQQIGLIKLTGAASSPERLVEVAQAVYETLPETIKGMLGDCKQLLICPDHRTQGGAVPFELLWTGENWLGIEKVVARFPDLRTLVRCLERSTRRDHHRRLLALAVPDAAHFQHLEYAADEVARIRALLQKEGWEVPATGGTRIGPKFILDRLPYLTHLHIAAHGEVNGSEESLILHDGNKLYASTLLGSFIPRMPTAYISACELGTSRWAGAGRAASMPYSFAAAGSRAVVANLLPVDDEVSSQLAVRFYSDVETMTFGEALRGMRQAFVQEGVHPVLWGSTVLFGDPGMSLAGEGEGTSLTRAYLDSMVLNRGTDTERREVIAAVERRLAEEPMDVRLMVSIGLLQVINEPDFVEGRVTLGEVADACRLAYEIDYLPLLGFLIYIGSRYADSQYPVEDRVTFYDNAINILESLEEEGEWCQTMLNKMLAQWLKLIRGDRAPAARVHGPQETDANFMDAVSAIMETQLAIEARNIRNGLGPVGARDESTVADVLWNAVMASRVYSLEGMPEVYDFSRILARKLINLKVFPETSSEEAVVAIAGILYWLWGSQNQVQLASEMIRGQVGVMLELMNALGKTWQGQQWYQPLVGFEDHMLQELESLEGLPYDDKLYPRIEEVMRGLESEVDHVLETTRKEHPERLCEATVWLIGCFIKHNTYSYTEGSVPEGICDKLKKVQDHIDLQAESNIYPWLDRGFKAVREEDDELLRWKYGMG